MAGRVLFGLVTKLLAKLTAHRKRRTKPEKKAPTKIMRVNKMSDDILFFRSDLRSSVKKTIEPPPQLYGGGFLPDMLADGLVAELRKVDDTISQFLY